MKRVRVGLLLLPFVAFATLLSACDDPGLTGKWSGKFTATPDAEIFLMLEDDSGSIFGSASYSDQQGAFDTSVEGRAEDGRIELDIFLDAPAHYQAHAQGDDMMTGTWFHRGMTQKLTLERITSD